MVKTSSSNRGRGTLEWEGGKNQWGRERRFKGEKLLKIVFMGSSLILSFLVN